MGNSFIDKKLNRHTEEDEEKARSWHRASYHGYFENFDERKVMGRDGRMHTQRVYCGDWYEPDLEGFRLIWHKITLCLLWAAALALMIICATSELEGNNLRMVGTLSIVNLLIMGWHMTSLFNMCITKRQMTISEYKSSAKRFKTTSIVCIIGLLVLAFATVVGGIAMKDNAGTLLLCFCGHAAAAALMFAGNRMEAAVNYSITPSEGKIAMKAKTEETLDIIN